MAKRNEINRLEGNQKVEKYIEKLIEERKQNDEKKKVMKSNTNYLEWIVNFMVDKTGFCDDDWMDCPEKINENDREHVDNLHLLYEIIEEYASKNYIYPIKFGWAYYYNIKYNNIGFQIGVMNGQGTRTICSKVKIDENLDFIDFIDIINDKKRDNVEIIETKLEELSNYIVSLCEYGIPKEALKQKLENLILNDFNPIFELGKTKKLKFK